MFCCPETNKEKGECKITDCLIGCCAKFLCWSTCLMSLLVFGMRLWIADIFWKSGLTKIDDWEKTVALFREEYKVPVLSPEVAAFFGTAVELSTPILLTLGLFTRLGALAMLAMVAVIEFTYLHFDEHVYWAFLLGTIFLYGPGKISLDHILVKKYCPLRKDGGMCSTSMGSCDSTESKESSVTEYQSCSMEAPAAASPKKKSKAKKKKK